MHRIAIGIAALALLTPGTEARSTQATPAPAPAERATQNAVLVLVDGLRWQEVFHGADRALIEHEKGNVKDQEALLRAYWREDASARRAALMPFFWETIATHGQILGDRDAGSPVDVTNGLKFSYPGYSEMLVGFHDPRIDSNAKKPNPNVTVLEFLHGRPGFAGKVAAFGVWDVVPSIVNRERCGFYVNAGFEPVSIAPISPEQALLNRLKTDLPKQWESMPQDAIGFRAMLEYFKAHAPRVLYFTFGETDEFAHEGRYDHYLDAARRTDGFVRELWTTIQSMPSHRGRTTLIVAADHGRGRGPDDWSKHNQDVDGAEEIWIAVLGPDTAALGARRDAGPSTQAQIAATLAAALGEDYGAFQPRAAQPLAGVLR
ncbi:MAG: alkaline phosphatase family protein [Planctomycetota bacterium]|nr:alkaline phosphatase family protein [Planctomycetota bacterium]